MKDDANPEDFVRKQFLDCFDTIPGRYVLGFIGVKLCNFLGRTETDEERVRRNVFYDILDILGLSGENTSFEVLQKYMDMPGETGEE